MSHVYKFCCLLVMTLPMSVTTGMAGAAQSSETFPSKPLRIVVPFPPGGGSDITARLVAQPLSEAVRQPIVIDNRGGAGGMIGTELVTKAAPDGYTILMAVASHAINPSLYRNVKYEPLGDFAPVTLALSFPYVLVVTPSVSAKSVKELIALAKSRPGKLTFASSGIGLTNHMAGELFKEMAAIDIVHVPYKGGGLAMNDVIGGHVSMLFGTVLETLPQARGGALRALAVTTPKRAAFAPDLPTVSEAGLPGYEASGWYSFLVPAATPRPIVTKLNHEIVKVLKLPAVKGHLSKLGGDAWPTTPEQAREFIAAEVARWSRVIAKSGLKAQ